jgi:anti-sigma factor RsiW
MTEPTEDLFVSRSVKTLGEYYVAPDDLRALIGQRVAFPPKASGRRFEWRSWWSVSAWLPLGAAFAVGALVSAVAIRLLAPQGSADLPLVALSSDHARALVTTTSIEVVSSDRHTVKPWLSKQLGVSPNVVDLADMGYPLLGGRRGFFAGTPVPVMVYGFKSHLIDLYALPDTIAPEHLAVTFSINGFHCLSWHQDGFAYVLVSDVDAARLRDIKDRLQTRWLAPGP